MAKIFGGSKSKSQQQATSSNVSYNKAYDTFAGDYASTGAPAIKSAIGARNEILGDGFEGYKKAAGFNFFRDTGLKNLMGVFGGSGTLQSGAAGKGLQAYGQNLLSGLLGDYLGQQGEQAKLGLSLGQLLGGAGDYSQGQSQSTGSSVSKTYKGFGDFIGSIIGSAAASDRRVKKDVTKVGEIEPGLNIYEFKYKDGSGPYIGVMADEVAKVIPEALGPVHAGFATVNYEVLKERYANV